MVLELLLLLFLAESLIHRLPHHFNTDFSLSNQGIKSEHIERCIAHSIALCTKESRALISPIYRTTGDLI